MKYHRLCIIVYSKQSKAKKGLWKMSKWLESEIKIALHQLSGLVHTAPRKHPQGGVPNTLAIASVAQCPQLWKARCICICHKLARPKTLWWPWHCTDICPHKRKEAACRTQAVCLCSGYIKRDFQVLSDKICFRLSSSFWHLQGHVANRMFCFVFPYHY